jgi:hypothetical protein
VAGRIPVPLRKKKKKTCAVNLVIYWSLFYKKQWKITVNNLAFEELTVYPEKIEL